VPFFESLFSGTPQIRIVVDRRRGQRRTDEPAPIVRSRRRQRERREAIGFFLK
jgi:hypothetical protein